MAANRPSLEARLAELDAQLREFESALTAQHQSQGRSRSLELELAALVERGAAAVRDLASMRERMDETARAAAREAAEGATRYVSDFEARAAKLLDAYSAAVKAANQAVARAEARIDAFDERVGHELAGAAREIRDAASLLRDRPSSVAPDALAHSRARRLVPALLAALLFLAAFIGYNWAARTLRDASARAEAAEREAAATRRDANQHIATIERSAQQASRDALGAAARAERMMQVLSAADSRRSPLEGHAAPDASGQVLWSPTRGAVFSASALPTLAAQETYQAWLVTARGSVSLGLLAPDAQGGASAAFEMPASLPGPIRGFMITREPAGGSPRPSRRVVLAT
jgi:hypothetical protein